VALIWVHIALFVRIKWRIQMPKKVFARYEKGTDTIRHVPTNVCLVAFGNYGFQPNFKVDAANKPARNTVERITRLYFNQPKEFIAAEISRALSLTPGGRLLIWKR
jgi:hypothetical protein